MTGIRSVVSAMDGYVPGEQPQAGKFIKLNTNENPYPPSPQVITAIEAAARSGLQRYPDPVATAFRLQAEQVLGVPADWILCGNGSDDILTMVTRGFADAGSLLRLPYPSYILYRTLAQIQDVRWEEVSFQQDWSLADDFVQSTDDLRLAFLPNPNSPSGTMLDPEAVLALAEQLPCPLLVDEAYADFAETHCLDLVARSEKIMVSRSFSKSYALAGLRFGFLVAQPSVIEQLLKVKDSYNCDALSIAGATAALGDQDWLAENRAKILQTRGVLQARLIELGFQVVPSQANFVWCTHSERPVKPLYEELKAERVLVRYMNYPGWGDGLRISVGTDEQVAACLELLKGKV
ncbi:MAG: histidinol-phosphate transaminase [Pirellulaceae bacterium]